MPYLGTSAALDGNSLVLNIVNRHRDQAIETELELQDKQLAGLVEVAEVNGPDVKAENDFGKTVVQSVSKSVNTEGKKLRYRFPAHSYTMLKAKLV